jgi:hypothetical protein
VLTANIGNAQAFFRNRTLRTLSRAALTVIMIVCAEAKPKRVSYNREAKLYRVRKGDAYAARYQHARQGVGPVQIDCQRAKFSRAKYFSAKTSDKRGAELCQAVGGEWANINTECLQRGIIAAEGRGISIMCAYVTTESRQRGYGFCKDSAKGVYRLMF